MLHSYYFLKQNIITQETIFLKFKKITENQTLVDEINILQNLTADVEISWLQWSDTVDDYNIMITDTYKSSLEVFFDYNDCQFCLKIVLFLTEQLISCLKFLHFRFIIYDNLSSKMLTLSSASWQSHQMILTNFNAAQKYNESDSFAWCDLEALD